MISTSIVSRRILSQVCRSNLIGKSALQGVAASQPTRWMSNLPYHLVVGMPALSPTMEAGVISEWKVGEGDSFIAGDSLAEIETDKATIDFEAQDDGVVAKILVEAGKGEIPVNQPIIITVEDAEDVAAFKDYVLEAESAPAAPEPPAPEPEPVVAATPVPEPVVVAAPAPPTPPPAAAVPTPPPTPPPAPVEAPPSPVSVATPMTPAWGSMSRTASPISKLMSSSQKKYIELYGSTGQTPL